MAWELKIVSNFFVFLFVIFAVLTLLVEKIWFPIRNIFTNRGAQRQVQLDTPRYEQERSEVIERRQEEHTGAALERDERRRERDQEKKAWVIEDKKRRLGMQHGGHRLGSTIEDEELEEQKRKRDPLYESRKIIEQQDREFEESLRQDQMKEQEIRRRKEAAIAKENRRKYKLIQLQEMAPQPSPDVKEGVCSIVIRTPSGSRLERRFYSNATLECLMVYVEAFSDLEAKNFQLVTNIPRKVFSNINATLLESGLMPKAVLIAEEIQSMVD